MNVNLGIGGGGGSISGNPCGACKILRRKCVPGCIFAPYFDSEQGASYFVVVHKVFGASNVSKILLSIPVQSRLDAVSSICYEAQTRLNDPVNGCVAEIFALQKQVLALQVKLSYLQGHLTTMESIQLSPIPLSQVVALPVFSIADLPLTLTTTSVNPSLPATFDVSSVLEPSQQRAIMDPRQNLVPAQSSPIGVVDLHMVADEFITAALEPTTPCSNASSSSQSFPFK